jgi:hypothetical protein
MGAMLSQNVIKKSDQPVVYVLGFEIKKNRIVA